MKQTKAQIRKSFFDRLASQLVGLTVERDRHSHWIAWEALDGWRAIISARPYSLSGLWRIHIGDTGMHWEASQAALKRMGLRPSDHPTPPGRGTKLVVLASELAALAPLIPAIAEWQDVESPLFDVPPLGYAFSIEARKVWQADIAENEAREEAKRRWRQRKEGPRMAARAC